MSTNELPQMRQSTTKMSQLTILLVKEKEDTRLVVGAAFMKINDLMKV